MVEDLRRRIAHVLSLQPDAHAIQSDGTWSTWAQLSGLAALVGELTELHGGLAPQVGILLRNRPAHVAALLGVLLVGGTVVVLNPSRGDGRTRGDITSLRLPVVIGASDDVATLVEPAAHTTTVEIDDLSAQPRVMAGRQAGAEPRHGVAVRMLTSGTTGPPKRVDLTYDMLARSVIGSTPEPSAVRAGVAIVNAPLVHIGGVFRVLQCIGEGRSFVLLPKFELTLWADAVREHRPRTVSLVPAALRMVLHSDLTRDDLSSILAVTSGTAPLSADDADAFTAKFGIPVLTSYAATEFGGGVASWTLPDYERHGHTKRGSVGRASGGAQLRVVDDDGAPQPANTAGLLEVKPGQLPGSDWLRTTDLARIDDDGFLWILGRADQAIIRGGFKVLPDDVRAALESHPDVLGAAVVGVVDARLGETPAAMVELRDGGAADEATLVDFLQGRLARYEIPTAVKVVATIPRTPSGKADLGAVRDHFRG